MPKKYLIVLFFMAFIGAGYAVSLQGLPLLSDTAFAQLQENGQPCPPECVTDSMEIVTWYPSPYNEYEELRLYPISDPNSQCSDANRGLMYYDRDEDKVKLCKGPAGLNNWQALSYWEPSTINTDDIYYNTGNVGIGTSDPQAKLDVAGEIKIGVAGAACSDGVIRYSGGDFEGCKAGVWVSLTSGGTAGGTLSFYGTAHTKEQCQAAGGTVTDYQSNSYCKFSASSCPGGWTRYQNLGSTSSGGCSGSCVGDLIYMCQQFCPSVVSSCTTGNHNFVNKAIETCGYSNGSWNENSGSCDVASYPCSASLIEVGCY